MYLQYSNYGGERHSSHTSDQRNMVGQTERMVSMDILRVYTYNISFSLSSLSHYLFIPSHLIPESILRKS